MADRSLAAAEPVPVSLPPHPLAEFWHYFSENAGAVAGLAVIVLVVLAAILAPVLAPYDPTEQFRDALLKPPAWSEGGSWAYPLGTDLPAGSYQILGFMDIDGNADPNDPQPDEGDPVMIPIGGYELACAVQPVTAEFAIVLPPGVN